MTTTATTEQLAIAIEKELPEKEATFLLFFNDWMKLPVNNSIDEWGVHKVVMVHSTNLKVGDRVRVNRKFLGNLPPKSSLHLLSTRILSQQTKKAAMVGKVFTITCVLAPASYAPWVRIELDCPFLLWFSPTELDETSQQ